ncbi:PREDICTED: monocarboxylate transporter 12-B-like [Priapulus caudatus]|uniref:Monocarboxylate transporter 12-B-like n=1 Tax=Priapulus caudatus TaxID=37621 RepID=A0ABM1EIB3_PRICU|nr:PREDICTED: monocarboxylate transporter 12-B-like [Priapulus caudatus]
MSTSATARDSPSARRCRCGRSAHPVARKHCPWPPDARTSPPRPSRQAAAACLRGGKMYTCRLRRLSSAAQTGFRVVGRGLSHVVPYGIDSIEQQRRLTFDARAGGPCRPRSASSSGAVSATEIDSSCYIVSSSSALSHAIHARTTIRLTATPNHERIGIGNAITGSLHLHCMASGVRSFSVRLAEEYGTRRIVALGAILATLGMAFSYRALELHLLFATYSLLTGLGMGMVMTPSVVLVGQYFDERRPLATIIASLGVPIGGICAPILTVQLIETYTWQGALLIMGGISLNMVVAAMLFRPLPAQKQTTTAGARRTTGGAKKKTAALTKHQRGTLALHVAAILCLAGANSSVFMMNVKYGVELGIPIDSVSKLLAITHITSTLTRLAVALLSTKPWFDRCIAYAAAVFANGVVCLVYYFATAHALFPVVLFAFGLGHGVSQSLMSAINVDLYGMRNLLLTEGVINCSNGLSTVVVPTITGILADYFGDTRTPFLFNAAITFSGASLFVCVLLRHRCQTNKRRRRVAEKKLPSTCSR